MSTNESSASPLDKLTSKTVANSSIVRLEPGSSKQLLMLQFTDGSVLYVLGEISTVRIELRPDGPSYYLTP